MWGQFCTLALLPLSMRNQDTSDDLGIYLYDDIQIINRIRTQNSLGPVVQLVVKY